eukprot:6398130-Pyramimonas_sp.AAC.1
MSNSNVADCMPSAEAVSNKALCKAAWRAEEPLMAVVQKSSNPWVQEVDAVDLMRDQSLAM